MTSGNLSDEPIAHDDDDAVARLGPLVDGLLTMIGRSTSAATTRWPGPRPAGSRCCAGRGATRPSR